MKTKYIVKSLREYEAIGKEIDMARQFQDDLIRMAKWSTLGTSLFGGFIDGLDMQIRNIIDELRKKRDEMEI